MLENVVLIREKVFNKAQKKNKQTSKRRQSITDAADVANTNALLLASNNTMT